MVSTNAITSQTSLYVKPSVFDLFAQEAMSDLLQPAFKKIIYYLSLKNPARYGWMTRWIDECYLIFKLLVERYYLVNCGSSFSEFIYQLQRKSTSGQLNGNRLPLKQELLSLLCLSLVPYLKIRMQRYIQEKHEAPDTLSKIWKGTAFLSEFSSLVHYLLYLNDKISTHSPLLRLCGLTLTYAEDNHSTRFLSYMSSILQIGALTLQFLQTWHSTDNSMSLSKCTVPPPPKKYEIVTMNECPLCKNSFHIKTVLATSGYTFCFKCIVEHLKVNYYCPITNIPSTINDLIQLFP